MHTMKAFQCFLDIDQIFEMGSKPTKFALQHEDQLEKERSVFLIQV